MEMKVCEMLGMGGDECIWLLSRRFFISKSAGFMGSCSEDSVRVLTIQ